MSTIRSGLNFFVLSVLVLSLIRCSSEVNLSLSDDQWKEDVIYLAQDMPAEHMDLFKKMKKADFENAASQLEKKIQDLEPHEIIVEIAKIVAMVNDGHSFVDGYYPLLEFKFITYPIRLYHYSDGIYIQSTHKSYKEYLGAKIISINDKNIEECSKIVSKMFSVENEMGAKAWTKYGLTSPEVLHAFKIINSPDTAIF